MSKYSHFITRTRITASRRLRKMLVPALMAVVLVSSLLGMSYTGASAAGITYYVDKTNGACSDSGPGSAAAPYCTLTKAATVAGPGDTIQVVAGSYAETVNPSASGTSGNPITYNAAPAVTVTGNGTATGSAFRFNGLSYITVNGFHIGPTTETGIFVAGVNANVILSNNVIFQAASHGIFAQDTDHVTITNNTVTESGHGATGVGTGIYLKNVSASTVSGNTSSTNKTDGIRLNNSTGVTVSGNTTYGNNAVTSSDGNGIALILGSSSNTVSKNVVYGNRDSGLQVEGVHDNVIVSNVSYGNGDHGVDVTGAALNNRLVSNTFHGNYTSGINLEGGSTGNALVNNVLMNNGLAPSGGRKPYNIYVDNTSVTGTTMDYDVVWTSGSFQISWNNTGYSSLSNFKAAVPTQEVNGIQGNPLFAAAAPVASDPPSVVSGNYHLAAGSAAIDNANSGAANETATDLDGSARVDDPATANTGAGSSAFYDRGAYEFQPGGATMPTVTTEAVTAIAQTTATGHGTVTALGSPNPTQHGVVWSTSANPTIADSKTTDGPVAATGAFTSSITGLTAGTLYHVRAYATNTAGTAYGADVQFTAAANVAIFTTAGTFQWNAPAGATSATVEVWGGGGKGGAVSGGFGETATGGGGGGAYSKQTNIPIVAGTNYQVVVGAGATTTSAGGDSYFINASTVMAKGGGSVADNSATAGTAGASGSGVGTTKFSGGTGAAGNSGSNYSGGAGSSAGTGAIGNTATNATGATAPSGGGAGGDGRSSPSGTGTGGTAPGGGGGGAYRAFNTGGNYAGGNGAAGQVVISYVVAPGTTTTVNCGAGTPSVTYGGNISCVATVVRASGSNTPSGTVTWGTNGTGSFAGTCTLAGSAGTSTCSVTYTPGAVGTGTHKLTATYPGDLNFVGSSGNQDNTVGPKALTMTGLSVPGSKIYDGTTAAVVTGTPALQAAETIPAGNISDGKPYTGDTVSILGSAIGTYNSKDVPTAANVAISGLSLTGAQAGNYTLTPQGPLAAAITAKALTMSGLTVPASKIYDGTTAATVTGAPALQAAEGAGTGTTADGKPYSGDTVGITGAAVGTYNSKDVASALNVAFSGLSLNGSQAANYTLTPQAPAAATITAKALSMTGLSVPASKVYDGTTDATVSGTAALLASEAAGSGTTVDGKPYTGDTVSITGTAVGTYNSKDVPTAANVAISGLSLTGLQAGNYALTVQGPLAATITPKDLTVSGITASNKVYDAGTLATLNTASAALVGNLDAGNVVLNTAGAAGAFSDKNVGPAKTVQVSGLAITGSAIGNYSLTQPTATADITAKALTVSGVLANNKIYNSTLTTTLNVSGAVLNGIINPDVVTLNSAAGVGTFVDKHVADSKPVTVTGLALGGAGAANYSLTQPTGLTANIAKFDLTATAVGVNKVYDGTTAATVTITTNMFAGDAVTGSFVSATFASKNVANSIPVSVSGISIGGADAGNYNLLNTTANTSANITAAPLTVKANNAYKHWLNPFSFTGTEFTITIGSLFDGDTLTSVTLTSLGTNPSTDPGHYPIVASNAVGTGLTNYNISYVDGDFNVSALNVAPVIAEGASTDVGMSVNGNPTAFSLTLHASDLDLDGMTWGIQLVATNGTASISSSSACPTTVDGTCSSAVIGYAPNANFSGSDHFMVKVDDGHSGTSFIQVNVAIGQETLTLNSIGTQDGWVIEKTQGAKIGGSKNPSGLTFNLGDDKLNRQYRGILSFDTSGLPDNAVVTGITLKIKQSGLPKGVNPFLKLGNLAVDVKKGSFGLTTLQLGDFQSKGTKNSAFLMSKVPVSNWYSGSLIALADTLVNKTGTTQMRLRFTKATNANGAANYMMFVSGNAAADQPQLIIQYYIP